MAVLRKEGERLTGAGFLLIYEVQSKCPVLGNKIDDKVFVDYQGKRIYFCCKACIEEFNKDPEKYLKKMAAEGITPAKTP